MAQIKVPNLNREPVYTGRGIGSPGDTSKITENTPDLVPGALTEGNPLLFTKTKPIGCNVKRDGKDTHWMPACACDLVKKTNYLSGLVKLFALS